MPQRMIERFKTGLNSSSIYTVEPMLAGANFANFLVEQQRLELTFSVKVDVYGLQASTGLEQAFDTACVMGLMGELPDTIDVDEIPTLVSMVKGSHDLPLAGKRFIPFDWSNDIVFHSHSSRSPHANSLTCTAYDKKGHVVAEKTYALSADTSQ